MLGSLNDEFFQPALWIVDPGGSGGDDVLLKLMQTSLNASLVRLATMCARPG
jgi:hypothetical protein